MSNRSNRSSAARLTKDVFSFDECDRFRLVETETSPTRIADAMTRPNYVVIKRYKRQQLWGLYAPDEGDGLAYQVFPAYDAQDFDRHFVVDCESSQARCVHFAMRQMLNSWKIAPIIVFDGNGKPKLAVFLEAKEDSDVRED